MNASSFFILLTATATMSGCTRPPNGPGTAIPGDLEGVIQAAIHPLMAEHAIPGMAVAVVVDGTFHFFNYGVASIDSGTPVDERTLFEIGSVSKLFTALLATYAEVGDKLSLADHPGRYIPELRGSSINEVRLLHLGTYTAGGLPLQFPAGVSDHREMIDLFRQWTPVAAPGAQRRYSNPSIGLLGHITGLALGRDFAEAIETELLAALGLTHSYVRVPDHALKHYAWGYGQTNEPLRVNPGMFAAEAYGIKTSSADLIRFVEANIDPSRLELPMRQAVESTQLGHFRVGDMVQGLGWEQYAYPTPIEHLQAGNSQTLIMEANPTTPLVPPQASAGGVLFNKTGSTNGFSAYVVFVPDRKVGLVMLANRNFPIPARVGAAWEIIERIEQMRQ